MASLIAPIVDPVRLMRHESAQCLEGLTDEEYFWEPVPGTWSVCPRDRAQVDELAGTGHWVLEFPSESPQPAPLTTIAWRLTHLYLLNNMYNDVLFGAATKTFNDFPIPSTAAAALSGWRDSVDAYLDGISRLDADDFERAVEMPWNETATIRAWTEWFTLHNTHHCAEVGSVRDFFRQLGATRPVAPARSVRSLQWTTRP